jgi:predicted transcriptional regulator
LRRWLTWLAIALAIAVSIAAGILFGDAIHRGKDNTKAIESLCRITNRHRKVLRQVTLLQRHLVLLIAQERHFSPKLVRETEKTFGLILYLVRPRPCP